MTKQSPTPKIATKKHVARLERERQQVALVRTISIVAIALVIILVGYGILDTTYIKLNKPVAEVNGEQISLGYWQERVQMYRLNLMNTLQQYQYYQQAFGMDTSQQIQQITAQLQSDLFLGEEVLNQLIDETLIRQEAEKRGITVTDAEVDEKLQDAFGFFPNGTPVPTITPTEFSYPTLTSEQLTLYPRRSNDLTVIKNSIMGGLTGFTQTFETRIHRWLEQLTEGDQPEQIEASGQDGLAVQEIIEAAIQSWETDSVVSVENA